MNTHIDTNNAHADDLIDLGKAEDLTQGSVNGSTDANFEGRQPPGLSQD